GLDALSDIRNWVFGFMLVFLSMTLGLLYMLNNIDNKEFNEKIRLRLRIVAPCFVAFFISTIVFIFMSDGFAVDNDGVVFVQNYKYLHNMLEMPLVFVVFIIGTLLVLAGIAMALFCDKKYKKGIFPAGLGTVMVVISLFLIAGYNNTAFYPSYSDIQSSLTIQNSSSSLFTLKTMSIVSLLIPFVLAYIIYAWYSIDKKSITVDEMKETEERY
ncbi:MAG: cytochrome d ubiquinol oxidase subunit II, partial [Bacteroidales bacterium]|nr:cytochrome d ubiquinol oxidase subunit II [Bacteroidales bacterium]